MRSSWKGAISFGLVTIPVSIAPAVEEHTVALHQVHAADGGRVRMKRVCELDDREVPYGEIAKGYETDDERTVIITNDDLAELPVPTKKVIDVLAFVEAGQIDPVYFGKPYYVAPEKVGAKPYALLRDAMAQDGRIAVTKIALSTRESPAVLRVHDDVLVLQLMAWPDEVRSAAGIAPQDAGVRPQELAMARSLMDSLSADFATLAGDLHDDYQAALRDLVEARLEGAEPPHGAPRRRAADNVIDLVAVLERSVKAVRGGRGRTGAAGAGADEAKSAPRAAAKPPAKNETPAKGSAPAKKTTSKTTASKSASARASKATAKKAPAKTARRVS